MQYHEKPIGKELTSLLNIRFKKPTNPSWTSCSLNHNLGVLCRWGRQFEDNDKHPGKIKLGDLAAICRVQSCIPYGQLSIITTVPYFLSGKTSLTSSKHILLKR